MHPIVASLLGIVAILAIAFLLSTGKRRIRLRLVGAAGEAPALVADGIRPVCYLPGNAGRIDAVERWIFERPQRLAGTDVFQVLALGPAGGRR